MTNKYCGQCGAVASTGTFCTHCGAPTAAGWSPASAAAGSADGRSLSSEEIALYVAAAASVVSFFLPWFAVFGVLSVTGADLDWWLWVIPLAGGGAAFLTYRDAEDHAGAITALGVLGLVLMAIIFVVYWSEEGDELLSLRFGFIAEVLSFLGLIVAARRAAW